MGLLSTYFFAVGFALFMMCMLLGILMLATTETPTRSSWWSVTVSATVLFAISGLLLLIDFHLFVLATSH